MPVLPESLPLGPGVVMLSHHPAGVFALDKPAGLLSHPNGPEDSPRSLLTVPYDTARECYLLPGGGEAHLIHRLDSPTSGVILMAVDAALATELRRRFLTREVDKTYVALVFGVPRRRHEVWHDRLQVKRSGSQLRSSNSQEGEQAACEMRHLRVITGVPVLSLLQLTPHTGRTHQLRVQCQKRRLPIVGDATYGDFGKNRSFAQKTGESRLFLHAQKVSIPITHHGSTKAFTVTSPIPAPFQMPR